MKEDVLDVAYRVLDDDLIDSEERRCGKVDDVEIEGSPGERAHLSALVVGPGAWRGRVPPPFRGLAARIFAGKVVRVPWSEIDDVTAVVKLGKPARELGLARGEERARPLIDWLPRS